MHVAMAHFLIILALVALGAPAMARDSSYSSRLFNVEPSPGPEPDELDAFFQTPEGQVAKVLLDAIERGDKMEAERIYQDLQSQYGWTPRSRQPTAQKPYTPPAFNAPLVLPPEAR